MMEIVIPSCSPNKTTFSNATKPTATTPMWVIFTVTSSVLSISGLLGNIAISTIIVKRKKMQTPTNWFIFNLSLCDLIIITTTIPFTLIHHPNAADFPFGVIGCKYLVMPVLEHFTGVSVLTHTAISLTRYIVIARSRLQTYINAKSVGAMIAAIWLMSFLVLSGSLMGFLGHFELCTFNNTGSLVHRCHLVWVSVERQYIYRSVAFTMTYLFPMLLTGLCYYKIHVVVRDSLGRVNSLLTETMLRKRNQKLRAMNVTLTVMYVNFAVLTLPLQILFCIKDFDSSHVVDINMVTVDVCFLLFYAQILSNPFSLLYAGEEYRKELRHIRVCCFSMLPRVRKWSRKIEGSFSRLYRRQTSEFTSEVDMCSLQSTSAPATPEMDGTPRMARMKPKPKHRHTGSICQNETNVRSSFHGSFSTRQLKLTVSVSSSKGQREEESLMSVNKMEVSRDFIEENSTKKLYQESAL